LSNLGTLNLNIEWRSVNVGIFLDETLLGVNEDLFFIISILKLDSGVSLAPSTNSVPKQGDTSSDEHADKICKHTSKNTKENWDDDGKNDASHIMHNPVHLVDIIVVSLVMWLLMVWLLMVWLLVVLGVVWFLVVLGVMGFLVLHMWSFVDMGSFLHVRT